MRKVKLQMQISLDGFVAGPQGQLDWMSQEMDPKQLTVLQELTESMDTILMGRKMTEGFTGYWENVVNTQPDSPEYSYAKIFVDTPKIVFTRTGATPKGKNVEVETGDLVGKVKTLKEAAGKDIIVYGGAGFAAAMIEHNLLDEINLFVNPVSIGEGLKLFPSRNQWNLADAAVFQSGVIFTRYTPK